MRMSMALLTVATALTLAGCPQGNQEPADSPAADSPAADSPAADGPAAADSPAEEEFSLIGTWEYDPDAVLAEAQAQGEEVSDFDRDMVSKMVLEYTFDEAGGLKINQRGKIIEASYVATDDELVIKLTKGDETKEQTVGYEVTETGGLKFLGGDVVILKRKE